MYLFLFVDFVYSAVQNNSILRRYDYRTLSHIHTSVPPTLFFVAYNTFIIVLSL